MKQQIKSTTLLNTFLKPWGESHFWKQRRTLMLALLALCIVLYFSNALSIWFMGIKKPSPLPINVETVAVKQESMQQTIQTLGTLSGIQEAKLRAAGQGRVQRILANPGSFVEAGTLLIHMLGGPEVRAPFAGFLTDFQVKVGEVVTAGAELVDLVNSNKLLLTYHIPEQYNSQLKLGQTVEVKVLAHKDKTFQGTVKFISPVIDNKTFTVLVKAELNNPDQSLKPGMSAHVTHVISINPDALVIPEACLMPTLEGYDVLLVQEGKIARQAVRIGGRKHGRVEILSGLSRGSAVVLTQNSATQEGTSANAVNWTGEW